MVQKISWITIFFILVGMPELWAQSEELSYRQRQVIADSLIDEFHQGVLIVRLPSKHKKVKEIDRLLASNELETRTRSRLEKDKASTITTRDRNNKELQKAFKEHFKFAPVLFLYDTAMVQLKAGIRSGFFLNDALQVDPQLELNSEKYFVLRSGTTSGTGLEALVLMDKSLKDLQAPFPYYVRVNRLGRVFLRIFSPKKAIRKDARKIVSKLDQSLYNYQRAKNKRAQRRMKNQEESALPEEG